MYARDRNLRFRSAYRGYGCSEISLGLRVPAFSRTLASVAYRARIALSLRRNSTCIVTPREARIRTRIKRQARQRRQRQRRRRSGRKKKKKRREETKKKKKKKKENRACRNNGAETRKGEANDISWTIVLWAATVAAIISRLTLLFPWRRYGFRIEKGI